MNFNFHVCKHTIYLGKLAYDVSSDRLFISDSNNHRIVMTTGDGAFVAQIGGVF